MNILLKIFIFCSKIKLINMDDKVDITAQHAGFIAVHVGGLIIGLIKYKNLDTFSQALVFSLKQGYQHIVKR